MVLGFVASMLQQRLNHIFRKHHTEQLIGFGFGLLKRPLRPNPSVHNLRLERFGDVIHPSRTQSFHLAGIVPSASQEDDRNVLRLGTGLDLTAHLKPVHSRHFHVQQHELDVRIRCDQFQCCFSVFGHLDTVVTAEQAAKQLQILH